MARGELECNVLESHPKPNVPPTLLCRKNLPGNQSMVPKRLWIAASQSWTHFKGLVSVGHIITVVHFPEEETSLVDVSHLATHAH